MGVPSRSRDRVEEWLTRLERSYGSFPVHQLTLRVPGEGYERVVDRFHQGVVNVRVRVYNDADEVLLVERDDGWLTPGGDVASDERLEAGVRRVVRDRAGAECDVRGLARATIAGVRDADRPDRGTVYRLLAVFEARHAGDAVGDGVRFEPEPPDVEFSLPL